MRNGFVAVLVACLAVSVARGGDKFPAAKHGKGELRYVDGVPVLTVRGTPAEMGEQFGVLAVTNAPDLPGLHDRFVHDARQETAYPIIMAAASRLKPNFPPHHAAEVEAAAKVTGRKESLFLFANTVADLSSGMGCSTVVVEKERSTTGGPLFGRTFDWLPTKGITEHTLVVVYKGEGKRVFAAVTVTPIMGVISGMNDAGLSVTINEISLRKAKDKSTFNWNGTPLLLSFRRVLEECGSVAEAEKLLRSMDRTTSCCLTVCDKDGGAVFEITPKSLVVRKPDHGVTCCTNHFRSEPLQIEKTCWRYELLKPLCTDTCKCGVTDVFDRLDEVQQGRATLQAMVFEPRDRVLNLAYGDGYATRRDPHRLELGKLFDEK
jgi:hypothetical protein